jgi:3-deoxy-manno-octulosonate cytidylyltransferase (CMP-KDO synthetase)
MRGNASLNIVGIIPARLASSRFPGKPLALIHSMPMIGHVYLRSKMCRKLDEVYVATCDEQISQYISALGGKVVMTSHAHERAADRTAEALRKTEESSGKKVGIVVLIQGDEPMITPRMIEAAVTPMLRDDAIQIVNLMAPLKSTDEHEDPNEVKVVVNLKGEALYFSREPIPSRKKGIQKVPMMKQVCVIPFRRDFLYLFSALSPTPLERIESVDMNRVLEHGYKVHMVPIEEDIYSVDTPEDLEFVERKMTGDPILRQYKLVGMPKSVV